MKYLAFIAFFCCLHVEILAQPNLDSLWGLWQDNEQVDTVRLEALKGYIRHGYILNNPDSALYYIQMQYDFAESIGNRIYMANAFVMQGTAYWILGNPSQAYIFYKRSLDLNTEIGDKKGVSISYNNIGLCFNSQGNYPKALHYYLQSLDVSKQLDDKMGVSRALINIGNIYLKQQDFSNALDYYQRGLVIAEETDNSYQIASVLNNIGSIYEQQGSKAKALENFEKSLDIAESIGNSVGMVNAIFNIGGIHESNNDNAKAKELYLRGLQLAEETDNNKGVANSFIHLGILFNRINDYQEAIDWCKKGLEKSIEIEQTEYQKNSCSCLFEAYNALNDDSNALIYYMRKVALQDSLQKGETANDLQHMEFANEVYKDSMAHAQKEFLLKLEHKEEVRKKNQIRNWIIGIAVFVLLLSFSLYRRLRFVRKSKKALQFEKDRSENLLLNILPEEIAEELKDSGKAKAKEIEGVSILFTDFKGFTAASSKLSAQDLVAEIGDCFEAFDHIMEKYGIEKIKTIGDAYMAAGGVPVPSEDSIKNTVLAAFEIQSFIVARKKHHDANNLPAFDMRVGIHTGTVVAGIVGVKKFQYDIWGDTVNTASRMESNGAPGKVNISDTTYNLLKDNENFEFERRNEIQVKGKGLMKMWFVTPNH